MTRTGHPGWFDEADEIHVSVAFTWDLPEAEILARLWRHIATVKMGGPAIGRGGEFEPGMYLKPGYVITSRGCPNRCWFCSVWKREGETVRELQIRDGWNVLDDNLLACSEVHIRNVFAMLKRQKHKPEFTGGLEAKRLQRWQAEALRELKAKQVFFAYDTPDDLEPLRNAGQMMIAAGFTTASHALRCYVLCGYPNDTMEAADKRMHETMQAGFTPSAMFYRDEKGIKTQSWAKFQKKWQRPAIIHARGNHGGE
jgi:hypothetical protein